MVSECYRTLKWIPTKYFVAIGAKDSYCINGEITNKIARKRGSLKYDILDAIIALGTGSLLYQTWGFYMSYIYIYIYIIYIYVYIYILYIYIILYKAMFH